MIDLIGAILGFLLTCMVLSYIFGDNPLFRFSVHLFIGVAAGFAGAVALRNVIYPNLVLPLLSVAGGDSSLPTLLSLVPVGLSLLLLTKLFPQMGRAGNLSMAFLVGVGAAVAVGGAITGTLFPQTTSAMNQINLNLIENATAPNTAFQDLISGIISISVTVLTLLYFHFTTRQNTTERPAWLEAIAFGGQIFIALTFGVVFAGVYTAALTALIDRLNALIEYVFAILGFLGLT
ncbi:MAG TPA: hypothetical protein PK530_15220 [Anaerolineales bacterium]|nr:hypothetical protein [Anaerolineales bacterium]